MYNIFQITLVEVYKDFICLIFFLTVLCVVSSNIGHHYVCISKLELPPWDICQHRGNVSCYLFIASVSLN